MRSSKSRSRSKSNRQRSLGNIINRVFDSSGPESKVRGTPQQIIDKYLGLARDAQLSNDRVAEQNFLQHAEHYTRMLGEAQREMQREGGQGQPGDYGQPNGQNGHGQQNGQNGHGQNGNGPQPAPQGHQGGDRDRGQPRQRNDERPNRDVTEPVRGELDDLRLDEPEADDGPGLVETPEARMPRSRPRSEPRSSDAPPRRSQMMPDMPQPEVAAAAPAAAAPTAEAPAAEAAPAKKPRAPRKPREKQPSDGTPPGSDGTPDAAE